MSTPSSRMEEFFKCENYALLGMSRRKRNFGWAIYDGLTKTGAKVYPVHPDGGNVRGVEFYQTLDALPHKVDSAIICFDTKKPNRVLNDLKNSGVRKIWLQQGSYDKSLIREAEGLDLDVRTGCAMMYIPQAAFPHRVHRFFHELFSKGKG